MIGEVVGQYVITGKLGEGGMGLVFKAEDLMVKRPVAIKMLRQDLAMIPEVVERFRAEARNLALVNHPNIAGLYSFFHDRHGYVMVIEYVPGQTLEQLLRSSGPLDVEYAIRIGLQALEGLGHAHRQGILHRDVKPANIIVSESGVAKVTDFGIARVVGSAGVTKQGKVMGTMEYMAPERLKGKTTDHRADLYAMGAVLYQAVTGHVPFEHTGELEIVKAHLSEPPPPMVRPGRPIPPGFEAVVRRALAKLPEDRFTDAAEFASALAASLHGTPEAAPEPAPAPSVPAARSGSRKFVIAATVLAAVLAVLAGFHFASQPQPQGATQSPPVRAQQNSVPPSIEPAAPPPAEVSLAEPDINVHREPKAAPPRPATVGTTTPSRTSDRDPR